MRALSIISLILLVVGAINWGLIGLFDFNLVASLFGATSLITRIVYVLVGLSGVYGLAMLYRLSESREDICVPGHTSTFVTDIR